MTPALKCLLPSLDEAVDALLAYARKEAATRLDTWQVVLVLDVGDGEDGEGLRLVVVDAGVVARDYVDGEIVHGTRALAELIGPTAAVNLQYEPEFVEVTVELSGEQTSYTARRDAAAPDGLGPYVMTGPVYNTRSEYIPPYCE